LAGFAAICSRITASSFRPAVAIRTRPQMSGLRAAASATSPPSLCPASQTHGRPVFSLIALVQLATSAA
jgi:hypothetical protein